MKNILEILKDLGVEVPDDKQADLNKSVAENYKTIAEHSKTIEKLEVERDGFKDQYETADRALKNFEGIDPEKINDEVQKYKEAAEKAEQALKDGLSERDFKDALDAALKEYKFTSAAAQNNVADEIRKAGLKHMNGKVLGLTDLISVIKEKDPSAFVDEDSSKAKDNAAHFTKPIKQGNAEMTKEQFAKLGYLQRLEVKKNTPERYNELKG